MRRLGASAGMMVAMTLAACGSLRTRYTTPPVLTPKSYVHADDRARASLDRWWLRFDDPRLDALIEQALTRNTDLAAAALRVRAAHLQQHLAVINPTLTAEYSYTDSIPSGAHLAPTHTHSLLASASYQLDLWDALAAIRDAARWEAAATEEDRLSTALTLIGGTANLYFQLAELNQRILLGEQSIAYARKTVDLVKGQASFGAASKLEIAEAEQSWESQQAVQTELLEKRVEARNALTVLLDGVAFAEDLELQALPERPPPPADAGLPASLLERRPDLQAAEMRLRASLASTDAVRSSFYPQLTLTSSVGTASSEISKALRDPVATLAGVLTAPFFQFNQARYSTQLARTQFDEAALAFRKTLLQALYDVDNALSARTQLSQEAAHLERSLTAAQEVERLFEIRYRSGAVALQLWLNAQETRRLAQISLAENRLARMQNHVGLCLALGGDAHSRFLGPIE